MSEDDNVEMYQRILREKGVKILEVKKRNMFVRFFLIEHYRVTFEVEGVAYVKNCWGGYPDAMKSSLLFSILEHANRICSVDNIAEMEEFVK